MPFQKENSKFVVLVCKAVLAKFFVIYIYQYGFYVKIIIIIIIVIIIYPDPNWY